MKTLMWKIRYARYMNRKSLCGLRWGWHCAGVAVEEGFHNGFDPEESAHEEMTYWGD